MLNAFGMAEGGLASDGSNFIDMFVDNVNYSTATPTFPMAQFEVCNLGGRWKTPTLCSSAWSSRKSKRRP